MIKLLKLVIIVLDELVKDVELSLYDSYKDIDNLCLFNSKMVLDAFHKYGVIASDFNGTSGYGYGDVGRDKIEKIYADVLGCESALVRNQFISGTHALTVAFFGILRPGDTLLSISGLPYDTLHKVIGISDNDSSLMAFNINYKCISLLDNDFDYDAIKSSLNGVKMVHIQRSIGYSDRNTLSSSKVNDVIKFIKDINKDIIVMVDNCYCEMCSYEDINADLLVGSLIKNLGAGICNNGAYIAGKDKYVSLCAERLTSPGLGSEVGPSLGQNKSFLLGLYMAPSVVASALKVKLFTKCLLEKLGYTCINTSLDDIVLGIVFNDRDKLIKYVRGIQANSAIDSNCVPMPSEMPGYDSDIIMASGSFTDGSSIELSCDAPLREPYIAYQQGSLTYEYGKIGIVNAVRNMLK